MLELLKDKLVFKLWLSRTASVFGDMFFDIFVTWKIYERSGDIKVVALLIGSSFVLKSLFALISGKISDKYDRKKVLVISDALSAVVVVPFIIIYQYEHAYILPIILLLLAKNFIVSVFSNSFTSYLADNVAMSRIVKAQALIATSTRIVGFLGAAAAGVLVAILPMEAAMALDSLTFVVSGLLVLSIKGTPHKTRHAEAVTNTGRDVTASSSKSLRGRFVGGISFIRNHVLSDNRIVFFCICLFSLNLVYGYIPHIYPYYISTNTSYGAAYLGLLRGIITLGEIIGLAFVGRYGNSVSKCFAAGLLGTALALSLLLIPQRFEIITLLSYFLYGLFDSVTQPYYSYTVASISSNIRGRVLGIIDSIVLISAPIGMAMGTALVAYNAGYAITVFISIIAVVLAAFVLNKGTRGIVVYD